LRLKRKNPKRRKKLKDLNLEEEVKEMKILFLIMKRKRNPLNKSTK
jgi:hypothetical protein